MIEIPCQFNKHTGPMGTGEHRITFDVQPEFSPDLYKALAEWQKNNTGILYFKTMVKPETVQERWSRNNRHIYSLFDEIAEKKKTNSEDIKKVTKEMLIKQNKIKSSLKELTPENQKFTIVWLEGILNE